MSQIEVLLDVQGEHRDLLESELRKQFGGLETVAVETKTQPVEPGTLAFPAQEVVAFILRHREEIVEAAKWVPFVKAVVNIVRFVLDSLGLGKGRQKRVVIKVFDCMVALPATAEVQKRFMECVASVAKAQSGGIAPKGNKPARTNPPRKKT